MRHVKGIPGNVRSEIIECTKQNVKKEEMDEWLVRDKQVGKIRYIVRPMSPAE